MSPVGATCYPCDGSPKSLRKLRVGSMCCALAKCTADFKDAARTAKIGSAAMGRSAVGNYEFLGFFFPDAVVAKVSVCRHPPLSLWPDLVGEHKDVNKIITESLESQGVPSRITRSSRIPGGSTAGLNYC